MSKLTTTKHSPIEGLDALVLCGGRGSRLKPLTDSIPKPMITFHGKPMLDHIIGFLITQGIGRFVLCIGYKGDTIRAHYARTRMNAAIEFSDAGEGTNMLRRLIAASQMIGDRFLCVYGDTFINFDPAHLLSEHLRSRAAVTIVTADVRNPFGVVRTDGAARVTSFDEKPMMTCYIGTFLAERSALEAADAELLELPDGEGLVGWFRRLAEQRRLASHNHKGLQLTFNTHYEKEQMEGALLQYYTALT
jgi:glucose-1-phosphate cytidylyltransferase